MKNSIILDVDTGIDDALAIILAINYGLDIKFICSCAGNTTAKNGAINTLNILDLIDAPDIPVLVGSSCGFVRTRHTPSAHGSNGLGGYNFEKSKRKLSRENYIKKYYDTLSKSKKPLTIIALGPLTNIANLLEKHPDCVGKIEKIVFMGSSLDWPLGNRPYAGFNVACDPEAVQKVLKMKVKMLFCPNNLGRTHYLTHKEMNEIKNLNEVGKVLFEICKGYKDHFVKKGVAVYDSATIFAYLFPEHTKSLPARIHLRYYKKLDTALTIPHIQLFGRNQIVIRLKDKFFKEQVFKSIRKYNKRKKSV